MSDTVLLTLLYVSMYNIIIIIQGSYKQSVLVSILNQLIRVTVYNFQRQDLLPVHKSGTHKSVQPLIII